MKVVDGLVSVDTPGPGDVTVHQDPPEIDVVFLAVEPHYMLEFESGTHAAVTYEPGPPQIIDSVSPYNG